MTKKYLLKFKPLEPYFFGGENTFRIGEKSSYYTSSLIKPSAATIIGTLRYELLKQNGILKLNGVYSKDEKAICDDLIGESSYTVGKNNSFGKIISISPVFLTGGNDFYIPTPQNCKANSCEDQYYAMEINKESIKTSFGDICLPSQEQCRVKNSVSEQSYMRLSDRKIFNNLFIPMEKSGNSTSERQNSFFKKKLYSLDKNFSFAVILELDESIVLQDGICYMGREKSAFAMTVEQTEHNIDEAISESLSQATNKSFFYVFGDTFVLNTVKYTDFAMVKTAPLRILCTRIKENKLNISCINEIKQIITAGSITYKDDIKIDSNHYDNRFGFNKIIVIKEKK